MGKTIKNIIFTAMAVAVLCAGTVSARQLRSDSKARPPWRHLRRQQSLPHGLPLHIPHGNGQSVLFVASHPWRSRAEVAELAGVFIRLCN